MKISASIPPSLLKRVAIPVLAAWLPACLHAQTEDRETYLRAIEVLTDDVRTDPSNAEAWFGLSIAHTHLGRMEDALAATLEAVAIDAGDVRFHDQLGEINMMLNRIEEAIVSFEKAVEIDPRLFYPRLRLGTLFLETGRTVSAITHLEAAVLLDVRNASPRRVLAMAYAEDGQLENAIAEYQRAIFLAPGERALQLELAEVYYTASMAAEAEAVLTDALAKFPGAGHIHLGLARLHVDAGRLREALDGFDLALASGEELPLAAIYKTTGDLHFDLIEFDEALLDYRRSLEAGPDNPEVLLAIGNLYRDRNMLDEALAEYSRAAELAPDNVEGLHGIAEIELRAGRLEQAIAQAGRVLELAPDFRQSRYVRGQALLRLGRAEEGRAEIVEYRRLESAALAEETRVRDIQALNREALTLLADGENQMAIDRLRAAIADHPGEELLYMNLASALSRSGLHEDAATTYLEAIGLGLGDALTHLRLSREYDFLDDAVSSTRHRTIYLDLRAAEQGEAR